jgi:hypothetical protein
MNLRPTAILILLLAMVPQLSAQDPPVAAERTHVVRQGETLSQIARLHFSAASAWTRIFEANRAVLSNPDRITPGMELVIPGMAGAPPAREPMAQVVGVVLEVADPVTGAPQTPPAFGPDDRRDLLRMRPFRPSSSPQPTHPRSVFYGMHHTVSRPATRPGVMLLPRDEVLAVPRSVFHSAAWLSLEGEGPFALGRVTALEGADAARVARTTLQPFDLVEVTLSDPGSVAIGDRLLAFHSIDRVRGFGRIMLPTGVLRVLRVEERGALARVETSFTRFELGHSVTTMREFPLSPGVHPLPVEADLTAPIFAFAERKEIYLPGDQAFIELGRSDGVSVGDEFVGVAGERAGWEGSSVATFKVIRVGERVSTVRISGIETPTAVRRGLELIRTRRMP